MKTLRAILPVLYRSTQYRAGDALPADNQRTVEAWIECGAAKWVDDEKPAKPVTVPQVETVTEDVPGEPGISSDGDPEALVGRVPKKRGRAKK